MADDSNFFPPSEFETQQTQQPAQPPAGGGDANFFPPSEHEAEAQQQAPQEPLPPNTREASGTRDPVGAWGQRAWHELKRTPDFMGDPMDAVNLGVNQAKAGYEEFTKPTETWGEYAKNKGVGALDIAAAPFTTAFGVAAHPIAATFHALNSLLDPERAHNEVADRLDEPGESESVIKSFGNPADVPRGKVNMLKQFGFPAASFSSFVMGPKGEVGTPFHALKVPVAKTAEENFQAGRKLYHKIDESGAEWNPQDTANWSRQIQDKLRQEYGPGWDMNPNGPGTSKAAKQIEALGDPYNNGSGPASHINEVLQVKEWLRETAALAKNPEDKLIARRATQHLQELMENTKLHNSTMDPKELGSILKEANANWSTAKLQEMYHGALEEAEMAADRTGKDGVSVYRAAADKLLRNKQTRRWIPKEHIEPLENIVKGSRAPNTLRWISNFFGGDESLLKGIGTAILTGEPMHGAAVVGGSKAAGALGERMTKSQWGKIMDEASRSSPEARKETAFKSPTRLGAGTKAVNLASTIAGRRIRNEGE